MRRRAEVRMKIRRMYPLSDPDQRHTRVHGAGQWADRFGRHMRRGLGQLTRVLRRK
jgi:hypothetical protein